MDVEATEAASPVDARVISRAVTQCCTESDQQSAVTVAKLSVAVGTPSREDAPQCWVIRRVFSSDNRWTWGIGLFRDLERDDEVVVGGGDGGGAGGGGAQEETRGNLRTILLQVNSGIGLLLIMKMI